jgi:type IX secretion system PorP/SprF family membrane protein
MRRLLFCFLLLKTVDAMTQVDPHFSQFYANPLWLNPGMAGAIDGNYRVGGIYRKQWSDAVPFTSMGVSAGITTNKNISFGISFMKQTAGDAGYNYLNAYGTVAYNGIKFGTDNAQQISIGIQGGLLGRKFDPAKFRLGDQWNPVTGYDPSNPTTDILSYSSVSVLDVGAGIFYADGTEGKKVNIFGGLAAFHLTRPEDPFIAGAAKERMPVRYTVHAGARIAISENFSLVPNLLFMMQGTAREKMLGLYAELGVNSATSVLGGMYYRIGDAMTPYAGVSFQRMTLGVSYDITVSGLSELIPNTNSIELSLTYTGRDKGKPLQYLGCPRF